MNLSTWLSPALDQRSADTAAEIAANPVAVTVRRAGRATDLALTVRIVRVGTRSSRTLRSEGSGEAQSDVSILAVADTDLQVGDRVLAPDGSVYRVVFVMPGQRFRLEADAVIEQ